MWFNHEIEIFAAFRFISYLINKKTADNSIDLESLQQETILKLIEATQRETLQSEENGNHESPRLSEQITYNAILKAYTQRIFENLFFDMNQNVTFRKKTGKERDKSAGDTETKTVQLTHLTSTVHEGGKVKEIYDVLPTSLMSPEEEVICDDNSNKFIRILMLMLNEVKDNKKRLLFAAFFSAGFRTNGMSQKQLGEQYGFNGSVAITLISRFVAALKRRIESDGLALEFFEIEKNELYIYFLSHQDKKVRSNAY